jgi:hypothetical protein
MATQLKHIQKAINKGDAESTATSTKSSTSAINTLSNFAEANSVPIYRQIQIVFFLIIACCLGANTATYLVSDLEWDNTHSYNNPISDIIRAQTMELMTVNSLLNIGDLIYYYVDYKTLNRTRIESYSPTQNYLTDILSTER